MFSHKIKVTQNQYTHQHPILQVDGPLQPSEQAEKDDLPPLEDLNVGALRLEYVQ